MLKPEIIETNVGIGQSDTYFVLLIGAKNEGVELNMLFDFDFDGYHRITIWLLQEKNPGGFDKRETMSLSNWMGLSSKMGKKRCGMITLRDVRYPWYLKS